MNTEIRRWYVEGAYKSFDEFFLSNKDRFPLSNCINFSGERNNGITPILQKHYPSLPITCTKFESAFVDMCETYYLDNSLDMVMSEWVLEHIGKVWEVPPEMYRILKPGGLCYMLVPFMYPQHTKEDYFRFSELGLKNLFESFGFKTLEVNSWGSSYIAWYISWNQDKKNMEMPSEIKNGLDAELTHPEKFYHHKSSNNVWGFFQK